MKLNCFSGGILYVLYALLKYLLEYHFVSDLLYWISLFFAPFSLLDCFRKISFGFYRDEEHCEFLKKILRKGDDGSFSQ